MKKGQKDVFVMAGKGLVKCPSFNNLAMGTSLVDLSDNMLTLLSADIVGLKHLEVLELSNNRLSSLPQELADLPNLIYLGLESNCFSEFPHSATRLPSLENLFFGFNALRTIPVEIGSLHSLRRLMLDSNAISEIHPGLFADLHELEVVSLSGNPLSPGTLDRLRTSRPGVSFTYVF